MSNKSYSYFRNNCRKIIGFKADSIKARKQITWEQLHNDLINKLENVESIDEIIDNNVEKDKEEIISIKLEKHMVRGLKILETDDFNRSGGVEVDENSEVQLYREKYNNDDNLTLNEFYDEYRKIILINDPNDVDKFNKILKEAKGCYISTHMTVTNKGQKADLTLLNPEEPYVSYYLNDIENVEMIYELIDRIYEIEDKPFKINIDFGTIWEKRNVNDYNYSFKHPKFEDAKRHPPVIVRNIETKELAKTHIDSIINYMITYPVGESNTKLICIYSVMIKVFRLGLIGTVAPGLEKFVKNKY